MHGQRLQHLLMPPKGFRLNVHALFLRRPHPFHVVVKIGDSRRTGGKPSVPPKVGG